MNFQEADEFNAVHGTQFIADLMPKTPIYTAMLTEAARAVMGLPHPSGRAAMRMLEKEGFAFEGYIDIFDGGPTMTARTDEIRTIREAREETIVGIAEGGKTKCCSRAAGSRISAPAARKSKQLGRRRRIRIDPEAADCSASRPATRSSPSGADGAARDQFRRHHRAQPQLCRGSASAISRRRAMPAQYRSPAPRRCRASTRCARISRSAWPRASSLPHRRPNRAWLAALGTTIERGEPALAAAALSASAMWAANAATVSPAPDTADGRCHLTVANLRTMPHRSHEWPATLAQLRLAFADAALSRSTTRCRRRSATRARPTTCGLRRHGEPGVEIFVYGVRGGAFPARQHLEASQAIARLHGLDPERTCSSSSPRKRSPPAPSTTTWSRSPTSMCCSPTSRRSPTAPLLAELRRLLPGVESSRCRRAEVPSPTRSAPICSTPSW